MTRESPAHAGEAALVRELDRVQRLHDERAANPILAGALDRLADWQSRRLQYTYRDLAFDPRYAAAIAFFRDELYGAGDYSRRDSDVARVVPLMVRTLPERVIRTVAHAMELNALSQELDRDLLARLPRADGRFTVADYCRAYRKGDLDGRRRQIELIGEVGAALDEYVKKPLIRTALAMMRGPAHLAGYGAMHEFLEAGFGAFRAMNGAQAFLATVGRRETAIMNAIVEGSDDAFPDPFDGPRPVAPPRADDAPF